MSSFEQASLPLHHAIQGFPEPHTGRTNKAAVLGVGLGVACFLVIASAASPRDSQVSHYAPAALGVKTVVGSMPATAPRVARLGYQAGRQVGAEEATSRSEVDWSAAPLMPTQQQVHYGPTGRFWGFVSIAAVGLSWIVAQVMRTRPTKTEDIAMAMGTSRQWSQRRGGLRGRETPEEAAARRLAESTEVEDRVIEIQTMEQLQDKLQNASKPDALFVLEVEPESDELCETGLSPEAEAQWKNRNRPEGACSELKHSFVRTARKCNDTTFLRVIADGSPASNLIRERLQVSTVPSIVFIKGAKVVWRHEGVVNADADLEEGIAYFGDEGGEGSHISELVPDLHTSAQVEEFTKANPNAQELLKVVTVLTTTASTCIHVFPAVASLAKNMIGQAKFARLLGDESENATAALGKLGVKFIPTMIVYNARTGEEVSRHVASSRSEYIVKFLEDLDRAKGTLK